MAVNAVRALLAAHAQSTWQRSRREVGTGGALSYAMFSLLFAAIVAGGCVVLAGAGFALGRSINTPAATRALGATWMALVLVGGIVGRGHTLDWPSIRPFPVVSRRLFLADLIAGVADLLPLFLGALSASLVLGVATAAPAAVAVLPFTWLGSIAAMLCLRQMPRVRSLLALAAGTFVVAIVAWPPVLMALSPVVDALPTTQSIRGAADVIGGRWLMGALRQLYPAAALVACVALAMRAVERGALASNRDVSRGSVRRWTFRSPVMGIARLHATSLVHSGSGIGAIVTPAVSVVIIAAVIRAAGASPFWIAPIAIAWIGIANVELLLNQFGLDGLTLRTILVLPVRTVELLKGKTLAVVPFHAVQMAPVVVAMIVSGRPAAEIFAAMCAGAAQLVLYCAAGHVTSARLPWPVPRNVLRRTARPAPLMLLAAFALVIVVSGVCSGGYVAVGRSAPRMLLPAMAGLLALTLLGYASKLPAVAKYVDVRRERLLQLLS